MRLLTSPFLLIYNLYAWLMLIPVVLIAWVISRVRMALSDRPEEEVFLETAGPAAAFWGWMVRIRFKVHPTSLKRQQAGQSYVFIGNHISFLDLLVLGYGIPVPFKALSRVENGKLPFFGPTIKPVLITVERKSEASRKSSYRAMSERLKKGVSVVIFPEGTRNRQLDRPLGPRFHDGAFRIAHKHKCQIVPIVITGCRRGMPPGTFMLRPGPIELHLFEPIPTAQLQVEELISLRQEVYHFMEEKVRELDPHFQKNKPPYSPQPMGEPSGIG